MNLSEFVKETLLAIHEGVKNAQQETAKHPEPSPIAPRVAQDVSFKGPRNENNRPLFPVEFDVAVTISNTSEISGTAKGGLITVLSASTEAALGTQHESATRIKFTVPIEYTS